MIDWKSMLSKQVNISWVSVLAILAGGYIILQSHYSAVQELALADQRARELAEVKSTYAKQADAFQKAIKEATAQQQVIERVIVQRDTAAAALTQTVTAPLRPDELVQADITKYMGFTPAIAPGGFLFTKPETQQLSALKIDQGRLESDFSDLQKELALEQSKCAACEAQLTALGNVVRESDQTIEAYKRAAKGSWKQRMFTVVKFAAVAAASYEIGRASK